MRKLFPLLLLPIFLTHSTLEETGTPPTSACITTAPWSGYKAISTTTHSTRPTSDPTLRAVTYNIHSGMGEWKGLWSSRATVEKVLNGIADDIVSVSDAPIDIVALNEVDFSARRSGDIDQARYIADALEQRNGAHYEVVHGQTRRLGFPGFKKGGYGNAVLVRHAISSSKTCLYEDIASCGPYALPQDMPSLSTSDIFLRWVREARGVIKLTIDFHNRPVDVIVTHLEAMAMSEREAQAAHLLRGVVDPARTTVVLGDINAVPAMMTHSRFFAGGDRTHDILTSGSLADARVLVDARLGRADFNAWSTFPAAAPIWPLDAALGSLDLFPEEARVMEAWHSDHRGFYVSYRMTTDDALIDEQRARHDEIRQRQIAQILACNTTVAARSATLRWLRAGTRFLDTPSSQATLVRSVSEL